MDEYELDLLDAVENATELERVENFENELLQAKFAMQNYLYRTKSSTLVSFCHKTKPDKAKCSSKK